MKRFRDLREHVLDMPTHSPETLAKKHGVSVAHIHAQLKKGMDVEHEHTSNSKIAREIALDHLGEKPDYYAKLDKAGLEEQTHAQHAKKHKTSSPCSAHDQAIGGGCYNCGYDPEAKSKKFDYKKFSKDRTKHPEKFIAGLEEAWGLGVRRTPSIPALPARTPNKGRTLAGMSLQQAVAHAKEHGNKVAYGTNSRKWHSIDPADRDFTTPFSYDPHDAKAIQKAAKFWDPKAKLEESARARKPHQEIEFEPHRRDENERGLGVEAVLKSHGFRKSTMSAGGDQHYQHPEGHQATEVIDMNGQWHHKSPGQRHSWKGYGGDALNRHLTHIMPKGLKEGLSHKVPVYHADRKTLVGHVNSGATSIGAAKLAKKKSAIFSRVNGEYSWVASGDLKESAEMTERERLSHGERMKPKENPPIDRAQKIKQELTKHDNTNDSVRKNLSQGGVDSSAHKTLRLKEGSDLPFHKYTNDELDAAIKHHADSATELRRFDRKSHAAYQHVQHAHAAREILKTRKRNYGMDEAYDTAFNESGSEGYKVGDKVVAKIGPHKGTVHTVIHVHPTGHLNIKPEVHVSRNKYHLGAAKADPKDVERAPVSEATKQDNYDVDHMNAHICSTGNISYSSHAKGCPGKPKKQPKKGVNNKTVQEAFQAAKDKKNGKQDNLPQSQEGANEPGKEKIAAAEPQPQAQGGDAPKTQDGGQPGAQQKKDNAPKPEASKNAKKLVPKGGEQFQSDPFVTPLTTMPDTAAPKSGSQGVR